MSMLKKLFTDMVSIDSPSGLEMDMGTYVTNWLEKEDVMCKKDSVGNIYGRTDGNGSPLLFCVHMDTVSKGIGIVPVEKHGYIQSDGNTILGADNKAAIAALFHAFSEYKKRNTTMRCLEFLFTVKEETGGGIDHIPRLWILAKKGLVFDYAKPLGGIILDSPWIKNFSITTRGKASHASVPEKGKNALVPMIAIISHIPIGRVDAHTMVNIGKISGGDAVNIIPKEVCVKGEVRGFAEKSFYLTLRAIKNSAMKLIHGTHVDVLWSEDGFCPGYIHKTNGKDIELLKKIFFAEHIESRIIQGCSGVSDANILNNWGIQTINLTDGVEYAHTSEERIQIRTLEKLSHIMYRCMCEF